jgi:hypothetical protein
MPIDPKKLSAMAGAARRPGAPSQLVARKKKAAPPPPPEDDESDDEDAEDAFGSGEEEETGPEEEADPGVPEGEESDADEQAEGNYPPPAGGTNPGAAIPALEQYSGEIEASCDELDYDMLTDPDLEMTDDDIAILQEGVLMLPPRLLKVIENLKGIDIDAATTIAEHLENEGMVDDAERVAGWIFRVGQLLDQGEEEAPEEEGAVEEDPEEEYAEEESGFGA